MKRIYLSLLLMFICAFGKAQNETISASFNGKNLSQALEEVEKQTTYRLYFNPAWTDTIYLNFVAEKLTLNEFLAKATEGTDLLYATDAHKNVYITKNRALLTELPPGFLPTTIREKRPASTGFDYSSYELADTKKKPEETKLYAIGSRSASPKGNVTIAGSIRESSTGQPVIGATVYIEKLKQGVSTDQFGYYSISLPPGKHELIIKSVGMRSTQRQVMLYADGRLDIEMDFEVTPLKEVVVESKQDAKVANVQMGIEKLDIQTMKQLPLALGETDIMKVVLTLPGVQSVGEGTIGLNVRGGATNQNLIQLNDAVVYNPSHLFGFFSTFNPDVLKSVELYKSGINAEYGGRISSVLDVHIREGNNKKISGSGGISPITGRFTLEGPIIKDKTSFIIGGRSTYSNWILRKLDDEDLKKSKAQFYDITAHIKHTVNENNTLYFTGYTSYDNFKLNNDTAYTYTDRNFSAKWNHIFNNRFYGVLTGTFSEFGYTMASNSQPANAFNMNFGIRQWNIKADVNYYLNAKHTLNGGINMIHYDLSPGSIRPDHPESLIAKDDLQKEYGRESAIYISDNFEVSQKLVLYAGLRYSFYQYRGPRDVFTYAPGVSRDPDAITDTLQYSSGKTIKHYGGLEPRLSLRYLISEKTSVKLSYNRMRQYIQMLSNTTAISPTDIWKLSDQYVQPQIGDQISLGFYRNLKNNTIEASAEVYYKAMNNAIDYKNGAVLLLNHHIETELVEAKGQAYGIELMLKKAAGKTNGWVTYTYSRSLLQTIGKFPNETVNRGKLYPSNFDKPHAVNFIGNYKFNRRFNFSLNLIYSTGRPITLPVAKFEASGTTRVFYSDRNEYRIPDYFRTDVSINIEGNHKIKKLAHSSWTFAVYNLTGRKNAYSVFFTTENGAIKSYKLSVFARPIPTITYNFKF